MLGLVRHQIIPEHLLERHSHVLWLWLHQELVLTTVLLGVDVVIRPVAIVHHELPAGFVCERRETIGKGFVCRIPLFQTAAVSLRVPPRVQQDVLVWNALLDRVRMNTFQDLLVVTAQREKNDSYKHGLSRKADQPVLGSFFPAIIIVSAVVGGKSKPVCCVVIWALCAVFVQHCIAP